MDSPRKKQSVGQGKHYHLKQRFFNSILGTLQHLRRSSYGDIGRYPGGLSACHSDYCTVLLLQDSSYVPISSLHRSHIIQSTSEAVPSSSKKFLNRITHDGQSRTRTRIHIHISLEQFTCDVLVYITIVGFLFDRSPRANET